MARTIAEKILAKESGKESVKTGDVVQPKIHAISSHDSLTFINIQWFEKYNLKVWDPKRVIFCFDHFMDASISPPGWHVVHPKLREFAQKQGIPKENLYDVGRQGNSHQIPAEEGWVLPGTFYVAVDTQAATMGGLNCYAVTSLGGTNAALVTGDTWLTVPEVVRVTLKGYLPKWILGKDIYFRLLKDIGKDVGGKVLEFVGPGIASMPIDVRMATTNGSPHLGVQTSIFAPDQRLVDYISPRAREPFTVVQPDQDAEYAASYEYDLGDFEPLVSGPDVTKKIRPTSEVEGTKIQAAFIGSCSGGRIEDLTLAAEVLKGKKVNPEVRLVVTPISTNVMLEAAEKGLLSTFLAAGAMVTGPGCGACGGNISPLRLADDEVCIAAAVENSPGRMGSEKAHIYLANAAVVAASAVRGEITDPRRS